MFFFSMFWTTCIYTLVFIFMLCTCMNIHVHCTQNGDTAMHDACRQGQLSLFYTLYAAKNDLNIANAVSGYPHVHVQCTYMHMYMYMYIHM